MRCPASRRSLPPSRPREHHPSSTPPPGRASNSTSPAEPSPTAAIGTPRTPNLPENLRPLRPLRHPLHRLQQPRQNGPQLTLLSLLEQGLHRQNSTPRRAPRSQFTELLRRLELAPDMVRLLEAASRTPRKTSEPPPSRKPPPPRRPRPPQKRYTEACAVDQATNQREVATIDETLTLLQL
jgi:hypothetical protein